MPALAFVTLDVFTTTRFAGNPLAVVRVPVDHDVSTVQMQAITREFNLSETIFIHDRRHDSGDATPEWRVRIFMAHGEIPFAGHPTIGAAGYVLSTLAPDSTRGRLICNAGPIEIELDRGLARAVIPHDIHVHTEASFDAQQLYQLQPHLQTLEVKPKDLAIVSPVNGMSFVCVELPDLQALSQVKTFAETLQPRLDRGWDQSFVGFYFYVVLTPAPFDEQPVRVRTRMIEGLLEDPATGSAACALCAFLALKFKRQNTQFALTQAVEMGRPSDITVDVTLKDGLAEVDRLILGGTSVKVMQGTVEY